MKIPFESRSGSGEGLRKVLCRAAARLDRHPHDVALVASHIFEQIGLAMERGEVVVCPGFGQFAVNLWGRDDAEKSIWPAWTGARALKNSILRNCPMDAARIAHQKVLNYRRNSHPRSGSTSAKADTMTAAMAFRERIRCDAGRMGIDLKTGDEGPARTGVSDQVWAGRLRRLEAHLVKARS